MRIELHRLDDAFHMEAINANGNTVRMDAASSIGGGDNAFRPMQLLLAALGGCSSIDVINILRKQREDIHDLKIQIDAKRESGVVPSLFEKIHVHFDFFGVLSEEKVKRAVDLSMRQYCSVAKTLEYTAEITYDYTVHKP